MPVSLLKGHAFRRVEKLAQDIGFRGCGKKRWCLKRYEPFHRQVGYVSNMRGDEKQQAAMFSYINLEQRVPPEHPLRAIRQMVDQALRDLSAHFDTLYARGGRPSIPPEQLLRAWLLQVLYGVRSERQLMEQVDFNLLYRWFVGLAMDEEAWD